jgi:hypothetical protein
MGDLSELRTAEQRTALCKRIQNQLAVTEQVFRISCGISCGIRNRNLFQLENLSAQIFNALCDTLPQLPNIRRQLASYRSKRHNKTRK